MQTRDELLIRMEHCRKDIDLLEDVIAHKKEELGSLQLEIYDLEEDLDVEYSIMNRLYDELNPIDPKGIKILDMLLSSANVTESNYYVELD